MPFLSLCDVVPWAGRGFSDPLDQKITIHLSYSSALFKKKKIDSVLFFLLLKIVNIPASSENAPAALHKFRYAS